MAAIINTVKSPHNGNMLLYFCRQAKMGSTKAIRITFFIKVCILVSFSAAPKHPHSGTRLNIASKKVRIVKNIIISNKSQAVFRNQRLNSRLTPVKNSSKQSKMVRYRLNGINH